MIIEEKELLLKDLCARLPYGVKVLADIDKAFDGGCIGIVNKIEPYVGNKFPELKGQYLLYEKGSLSPLVIDEVRPYLRPMSSMTEEEDKEWQYYKNRIAESCDELLEERIADCHNFFNSHHLDYRGLIEKGLAIDCTGLNIY